MVYHIDSIADGIAVLQSDDLQQLYVPVSLLPNGSKEGDVLSFDGNAYVKDESETALQRRKMFDLQQKLMNKKK